MAPDRPHAMDMLRAQPIVKGGSSGDLLRITMLVAIVGGLYWGYRKLADKSKT